MHRRMTAAMGFPGLGCAALIGLSAVLAACVGPPVPVVTLVERAVEARSFEDITEDNRIVVEINAVMADLGTIDASTEIYEQRLLITGSFDDIETFKAFRRGVDAVEGVKTLYWHATFLSEDEREARDEELLDWGETVLLDNTVGINLIGTEDIADVNLRVAADTFGIVYLLGRARSHAEHKLALKVARATDGVKKVVDYVEVRP